VVRPATAAPTRAARASKTRALGSLSRNPPNTSLGVSPSKYHRFSGISGVLLLAWRAVALAQPSLDLGDVVAIDPEHVHVQQAELLLGLDPSRRDVEVLGDLLLGDPWLVRGRDERVHALGHVPEPKAPLLARSRLAWPGLGAGRRAVVVVAARRVRRAWRMARFVAPTSSEVRILQRTRECEMGPLARGLGRCATLAGCRGCI
jgi:hypothetical protein